MGELYTSQELESYGLIFTTAVDQLGLHIYRRPGELFLMERIDEGLYRLYRSFRSRRKRED